MAEYIEKEAILERLDGLLPKMEMDPDGLHPVSLETVIRYIKNWPAADVAPVVHGEWKLIERENVWGDMTKVFECTACNKSDVDGKGITRKSLHCPNCGARMRVDEEEKLESHSKEDGE